MITCSVDHNRFIFPVGEMHVQLAKGTHTLFDVIWEFEDNDELIELLLICDAAKRRGDILMTLTMPYVPFARQDRVNIEGEPLSIAVFADLINRLGFQIVIITDPHSDVTPALLTNCKVIEQHTIFAPLLKNKEEFYLVSPDAGALKKIYKLAKLTQAYSVIECSKQRDVRTGEVTCVVIHDDDNDLYNAPCVIVDDICDGGKTFVTIATELKAFNSGPITLMVTHGFFTKGLGIFDGLIDYIYTRKGQVK